MGKTVICKINVGADLRMGLVDQLIVEFNYKGIQFNNTLNA